MRRIAIATVLCAALAMPAFSALSRRTTPVPLPVPTTTPTPARLGVRISGVWWPTGEQVRLDTAFGTWPGSRHARREWWYGVPGDDNGWIPSEPEILRAIDDAHTAGRSPRFFVAEPASAFWCRELGLSDGGLFSGGRVKAPEEMPETLTSGGTTSEAIRARISLLRENGVKRGGILVAPYTFGVANRDWWVTPALERNLPWIYPAGHEWRTGAPDPYSPGDYLDYPDAHVIRRDAFCLDWWLYALRGQYPDVGRVVTQASNCSGAYGWRGAGLEMYGEQARLVAKHRFAPHIQIEGANLEATGGDCGTAYADCTALRAIERANPRPRISIFWGPTFAEVEAALEACP